MYDNMSRRQALSYLSLLTGMVAAGSGNIADLILPKEAYATHEEHTANPIRYHGFNRTDILKDMSQPVRETLPRDTAFVSYDSRVQSTNLNDVVTRLIKEYPEQPVFVFMYVDEVGKGLSALKYGEAHRSSSRALAAIFKRLKEEYKGQMQLVGYDIGGELDNGGTSALSRIKSQMELKSVPTTFIYFRGQTNGSVEVDRATCDFLDIEKFNSEYARLEDWMLLNVVEPAKDGTVWRFNNTPKLQKTKK